MLSKMDLVEQYGELAFGLDFYLQVRSLQGRSSCVPKLESWHLASTSTCRWIRPAAPGSLINCQSTGPAGRQCPLEAGGQAAPNDWACRRTSAAYY